MGQMDLVERIVDSCECIAKNVLVFFFFPGKECY